MNVLDDLSGQIFGIWKVLAFDHMKWNGTNGKHGMSYYKCECQKCGKIFHLDEAAAENLVTALEKNTGFEVSRGESTLVEICKNCGEKK